jgi:DNA transformation protein
MPDDSFKEFVLDQLGALQELRARAMFGAHGIYCGDKFFGILHEGRLFFKTDGASAADHKFEPRHCFDRILMASFFLCLKITRPKI